MNFIRFVLIIFVAILASCEAQSAFAQAPVQCPDGYVCLTRAAAEQAYIDAKTVDAQKTQIAALEKTVDDLKTEVQKARIDFAESQGELTQCKQYQVRSDALLDLALKNTKKKRNAFITIF